MTPYRTSAFLDTSVLYSAVLSPSAQARSLLRLGELNLVRLWVSPAVLREADRAVRRMAPTSLPVLALLQGPA